MNTRIVKLPTFVQDLGTYMSGLEHAKMWGASDVSKFLSCILRGYPTGEFVETVYNRHRFLVDGRKRVMALSAFTCPVTQGNAQWRIRFIDDKDNRNRIPIAEFSTEPNWLPLWALFKTTEMLQWRDSIHKQHGQTTMMDMWDKVNGVVANCYAHNIIMTEVYPGAVYSNVETTAFATADEALHESQCCQICGKLFGGLDTISALPYRHGGYIAVCDGDSDCPPSKQPHNPRSAIIK